MSPENLDLAIVLKYSGEDNQGKYSGRQHDSQQ
jgi:hypothetical protein